MRAVRGRSFIDLCLGNGSLSCGQMGHHDLKVQAADVLVCLGQRQQLPARSRPLAFFDSFQAGDRFQPFAFLPKGILVLSKLGAPGYLAPEWLPG